MMFNTSKEWKQFLSAEDEEKLNEFLKKVSRHRGAYKNSSEVKNAQLWCAILELRKENVVLQKRLDKMQYVFDGLFARARQQDEEDMKLLRSLDRF